MLFIGLHFLDTYYCCLYYRYINKILSTICPDIGVIGTAVSGVNNVPNLHLLLSMDRVPFVGNLRHSRVSILILDFIESGTWFTKHLGAAKGANLATFNNRRTLNQDTSPSQPHSNRSRYRFIRLRSRSTNRTWRVWGCESSRRMNAHCAQTPPHQGRSEEAPHAFTPSLGPLSHVLF